MTEPDVADLLTVARAIEIIDAEPVVPRAVDVPLDAADGLILAEAVVADRDYPPFDKSLMDGYAIRSADQLGPATAFHCLGELAAGASPTQAVAAGETVQVMTGAPMPPGADGVVPVESREALLQLTGGGDGVRLGHVDRPSRFVAKRGSDVGAGATVLQPGVRMGAAQVAVAASVGAATVRAFARPRVAVLGTGDELVPAGDPPGPAQIRNANNPMLVALLRRLGCDAVDLGTAPDDPAAVRAAIARGLAFDVLFVTGGMSMGAYDYVPRTLVELGATMRVTKLRIKPGKPFVFATAGEGSGLVESSGFRVQEGRPKTEHSMSFPEPRTPNPAFVFGLPGNPVSAFVCTLRLAARLLARLAGAPAEPAWREGRLTEPLPANGPREFYQPATFDGSAVRPLHWKGSADVFTLAAANALIVRAESAPPAAAGDVARVLEIPS